MKRKIIIISIAALTTAAVLFLIVFGAGLLWEHSYQPIEIKKGFSDVLLNSLRSDYGITIPDDAEFIKGINTNTFRDPSVIVIFKCPVGESSTEGSAASYIMTHLKMDLEIWHEGVREDNYAESIYGGIMQYRLSAKNQPFTSLSFKVENEYYIIRLIGESPTRIFP